MAWQLMMAFLAIAWIGFGMIAVWHGRPFGIMFILGGILILSALLWSSLDSAL